MAPTSNPVLPGPDQVLRVFWWHPNRVPRAHTPIRGGQGTGPPVGNKVLFPDLVRSVHNHLERPVPRPAWTRLFHSETSLGPVDGCFHRRTVPRASRREIGISTPGPLRSMGAATLHVVTRGADTNPYPGGLHA